MQHSKSSRLLSLLRIAVAALALAFVAVACNPSDNGTADNGGAAGDVGTGGNEALGGADTGTDLGDTTTDLGDNEALGDTGGAAETPRAQGQETGSALGGAATGGTAVGDADTGGAETGGALGGEATGGAAVGSETGGAATGGATGGAATGGAAVGTTTGGGERAQGAAAAIDVAQSDEYGEYLVTSQGQPLYLFTDDTEGTSNCTGQCAQNWPPLVAAGETEVSGSADASLLGTTERDDGTMQVTYNGHPLYTYVQDQGADSPQGQGVGDKWYLVTPQGEQVQAQ